MHLVQGTYSNARSRVRIGEGYSEEFEVKVGVHQGSVLSLARVNHNNVATCVALWGKKSTCQNF